MTLSEIYRKYLHELQMVYSKNEAAQITSIAFESIADIRRADVVKEPSLLLPTATLIKLEHALSRLQKHEPIQHITGEAWFCDLKFQVSPAVLVPRPETEELVALASSFIKDRSISVLDIGTGSGCIAISLKEKHSNIAVTAIDISEEALHIARKNNAAHNSNVQFKKMDFLEESSWKNLGKMDVIVSNPPYIPVTDKDMLDKNVTQFEPHTALFEPAGQPLTFYQKIAAFGRSHLQADGKIFVEIHEDFGEAVLELFLAAGYRANLLKDMFGKERFVEAVKV